MNTNIDLVLLVFYVSIKTLKFIPEDTMFDTFI